MAGALLDRLNPKLDPTEQRHVWARLRTEITTGWQTEEHPRQSLTVADEREYAMFHLAEVMYRIVPQFYEEVGAALQNLWGTDVSGVDPPVVLRFGTWVGGDMQGAPDVHAKTIRETLARQHQVIVNEYHARVPAAVAAAVAEREPRAGHAAQLRRRIDEYMVLLPGARTVAPARHDQMPYRVFFAQVAERLRQTWEAHAGGYERVEQLRADLVLAADSLKANRGLHAGYQLVRRLLLRVDTFGFHLATLDLKQRADVHHRVIAQGIDDTRLDAAPARRAHREAVGDPAPRRRSLRAAGCAVAAHAGGVRGGRAVPRPLRCARHRQLCGGWRGRRGRHPRAAGAGPLGGRR